MSDLNVTTISNSNIAKTDKLLAFNNNDSKAATIQDVVQLVPGVMAIGVCDTAANVSAKVVTCADWNNKAGQSILITFTYANTASNPTLNINGKGALPIYNGSTREEYIPEGNMLLIVNSDCTKLQVVANNSSLANAISGIQAVIPSGASSSNKLVAKSEFQTDVLLNIGGSNSKIIQIDVELPFGSTSYGRFTELRFQGRRDNTTYWIGANDGEYFVRVQPTFASAGWLYNYGYKVTSDRHISLFCQILNYPANVGVKLSYCGLDGTRVTNITALDSFPSGIETLTLFQPLYRSDLTSTVASGSTAPITSGAFYPTAITTPTPVSGVTAGASNIYGYKSGKMVTLVLNGVTLENNIFQNKPICTDVPTAVGMNVYFTVMDYNSGKTAVMSIINDILAAAFQSDDPEKVHSGRYWGTVTYMTSD